MYICNRLVGFALVLLGIVAFALIWLDMVVLINAWAGLLGSSAICLLSVVSYRNMVNGQVDLYVARQDQCQDHQDPKTDTQDDQASIDQTHLKSIKSTSRFSFFSLYRLLGYMWFCGLFFGLLHYEVFAIKPYLLGIAGGILSVLGSFLFCRFANRFEEV